jgi:hypothetical protein
MAVTNTMGGAYYDWPDGARHTISYAQHLLNVAAPHKGGAPLVSNPAGGPAAGGPGSAGPPAPPPDPRDATYNAGVAHLLFNNTNQRNQIGLQGTQATEDFNTMLARMADNRAKDLLSQNHAANHEGLFYSGQLSKRRGDVEKGYSQQQSDAQTAYDRAAAARAAALQQLGGITADPNNPLGYTGTGQAGLDLSDLYAGAIARQQALGY